MIFFPCTYVLFLLFFPIKSYGEFVKWRKESMCCVIWIGRGRLHAWFKCLAFTLSLLFLLHISEHVGKKFPWMQLIWEKDNFFSLVRCSSKVCHMVNSSSLQCCPVRQNESASSIHTCGGFTYWWFTSNYIDIYIYSFTLDGKHEGWYHRLRIPLETLSSVRWQRFEWQKAYSSEAL